MAKKKLDKATVQKCFDIAHGIVERYVYDATHEINHEKSREYDAKSSGAKDVEMALWNLLGELD